METWIVFTLLAVVMQSVRTAGQKQLARAMTAQATTLVRFLFGLPFAVAYFLILHRLQGQPLALPDSIFLLPASLAAVSQILATVCLVKALTLRNFAVGTALAKTEAIMTAIIGAWFFAAPLNLMAYVAVLLGVGGVLVASNWRARWSELYDNHAVLYGLGAGLGFAMASLWIREASLALDMPRLLSASLVLLYMVALQASLCLAWVLWREAAQLRLLASNFKAGVFIGFTSVAGSVGWFTAMSLQEAALVKTLGQVEFVVTLLITYLYFGERISLREYLGIALVALSVFLLIAFV